MKIVVSGGSGVGKTTFIGAISEIETMDTVASMASMAEAGMRGLGLLSGSLPDTVALDFGRVTLDSSLILYLFGTPAEDRSGLIWDELSRGALGAVVLADARHIEGCLPTTTYFRQRRTPFLLAINNYDGVPRPDLHWARKAARLTDDVPIVNCDARDRDSVKYALLTLLDRTLARRFTVAAGHPAGRR